MPDSIKIPPAPKDWRMSRDQIDILARDPQLRRMSRDEQYWYFQNRKGVKGPATPRTRLQQGADVAMALHPKKLFEYVGNAFGEATKGAREKR